MSVILAGRGVIARARGADIEELAEPRGAMLATTLPARGIFDHNPFCIGISGGYARGRRARSRPQADLVIAIGASLSYYTVDAGDLFRKAEVVQIDIAPLGLQRRHAGRRRAICAPTRKLAAEALGRTAARSAAAQGVASARSELARRIEDEPADAPTIRSSRLSSIRARRSPSSTA